MSMTIGSEAKVTKRQHVQPCHDCPWRRNSIPGWLGELSVQEWHNVAHGDGVMECHTTKQDNGDPWQCAGGAIYRANVCKRPNNDAPMTLPPDEIKVFSFGEFEAHHNKGVQP